MSKLNRGASVVKKKKQKKKLHTEQHKLTEMSESSLVERDNFFNKMMALLSKHFGYYKIRPLSKRIIVALTLQKRDVCAVLAPGYGKSICYQLPAVLNEGLVVVVTPITFSITEQVQRLNMSGLYSCILENCQDYAKKINDLISAKCKIVYVPPQILIDFRESVALKALKNANIQLIAILEAHCVSPFSHDYRLMYRDLAILKENFPTVPILAVTSAPALQVRTDITSSLKLEDPLVVFSDCQRPNIYLQVSAKRDDHLIDDILSVIAGNDGPTLIYTLSRSQVIDLVAKLKGVGITTCRGYYVGQSVDYINKTYQAFASNEFKILVTTSGGGLIVSKPDIRNVIHCHAPKDIESYYQEIGRAGRDGLKAKCVLFYSERDMETHKFLRCSSKMPGAYAKVKFRMDILADILKSYAVNKSCRWAYLLNHFDDVVDHTGTSCNNCDNCKMRKSLQDGAAASHAIVDHFLKYLKQVQSLNDQKIPYEDISSIVTTDPAMESTSMKLLWSKIAEFAKEHGFIEAAKTDMKDTYILSPKGMQMLARTMNNQNKREALSNIPEEMNDDLFKLRSLDVYIEPTGEYSVSQINRIGLKFVRNELLEKLKAERLRLSVELNCLPYLIASDKALKALWFKKPTTPAEIVKYKVEGFSSTIIHRFGDTFLKIIRAHIEQEKLKSEEIAEKGKEHTVETEVKET